MVANGVVEFIKERNCLVRVESLGCPSKPW